MESQSSTDTPLATARIAHSNRPTGARGTMTNIAYTTTKTPAHELVSLVSEAKGWLTVEIVESESADRIGTQLNVRRKWLDQEYAETQDGWQLVMDDINDDQEVAESAPVASDSAAEGESESAPVATDDSADDAELTTGQRMGRQLRRYAAAYVTATNASGKKTKVNGDDLAMLLLALTPEEVASLGSLVLDMPSDKYAHLNPGQQRMNWGNRLRAAIRNETIEFDTIVDTIQNEIAEGAVEIG